MMNPIFPTEPARVNIHLLPSEAEFISYYVDSQALTIRAWMPANYSEFEEVNSINREYGEFYSNHCSSCPRRTLKYLRDTYPVFPKSDYYNNDVVEDFFRNARENQSECDVWWRGFNGQHCMEGHEFKPKEAEKISISNMVFDIKLNYKGKPPRFEKVYEGDNAHLRAGYKEENGEIYQTPPFAAANVYSGYHPDEDDYTYGKICWGRVSWPENLRGIVSSYFQSNFNNDLLRLSSFRENIYSLKDAVEDGNYHKSDHKFLCSGYDCLIMIDADQDVQAFFTMLMAGFTPIPEAPHVMIIPAKTSTIQKEDSVYFGYTTQEDAVGRKWYISSEGYLIGQLDESFVTA